MITTPAILLRSRDVGEADRIYTFYTRDHGKIEALATGVRKIKSKLAGHCVEHAVIQCTFFPGRERMRLVAARKDRQYAAMRGDFVAFGVAVYAREAVDAMTRPGITDAVPFDLLCRLFDGLTEKKAAPLLLLHAFLFHLLAALGYRKKTDTIAQAKFAPTLLHDHIAEPLPTERFLAFFANA